MMAWTFRLLFEESPSALRVPYRSSRCLGVRRLRRTFPSLGRMECSTWDL